jgi:hypothetical protein
VIEIQERAMRASEVKTGDRLVLSDRLVTQAVQNGRNVILWHGSTVCTVADQDALIRVKRSVRLETVRPVPRVDDSHVWLVEAQRGSQARYGAAG